MDKSTHKVRCEQWLQIINTCLQSGMNKTAWCRKNGISDKSFFYWQRILRNEAYLDTVTNEPLSVPTAISNTSHEVSFVELSQETYTRKISTSFSPDVVIRSGNVSFEVSNSVSPELIRLIGGLIYAK